MALTDESNGMIMPVQPMGNNYGGYPAFMPYGNNGGLFGNGGDSWLGILFLIALCNGGFGFGGFGGGWGMMNGMWGMDGSFPWILASNANNQNATNAGFDNLGVNNALNGISSAVTSGFGDVQLGIAGVNQNICQTGAGITNALNQGFSGVQTSLCNGFNSVNQGITNGFNQAEIAANGRQMANMQQAFNSQTAITGGLTNLSSQLAQCCCDNRLATANLQSVIQAENCADRAAVSDGIRDILTATQAQNQRILDKLCDQELQAERRENAELRTRLNMADLAASQAAQTAALVADNTAQTQYIVNRVAPYPVPSYNVPNPYGCGCGNNFGCGCNG